MDERGMNTGRPESPPPGGVALGRLAAAFSNAPGSTYFYSSLNHRRLLDGLLSAMRGRMGMHLVLGDFGTGKTTLCNYLLMAYGHEFDMVYLGNPFLTETELFGHMGSELGVPGCIEGTAKERLDALTAYLRTSYATNKPVVVFIDEAHLLEFDLLDRLLVLSNLQEAGIPLLQIVLVGVPKLLDILAAPRFTSLNQRIGSRHMLRPLTLEETAQYIRQRLAMAGGQHAELFGAGAMAEIHRLSGGRPRLINMLCRLSLENLALEGGEAVSGSLVRRLARDPSFRPVFEEGTPAQAGDSRTETWRMLWPPILAAVVVGGISIILAARLLREAPVAKSGLEYRQSVMERTPEPPAALDSPVSSVSPGSAVPQAPQSHAEGDGDLQPWPLNPPGQQLTTESTPQPETAQPPKNQVTGKARQKKSRQADGTPRQEPAVAGATTAPVVSAAPAIAPSAPRAHDEPLPADLASAKVQAIAWSRDPENRIAMVGGTVLHIGDGFGGGSVTAINEDHLVLSRQGQRHVLRLAPEK